jgi:hypothetical protein
VAALEDDLADELNGDTSTLPTARSLLDVSATELADRLEVTFEYSQEAGVGEITTVDIIIFDSNFTNATFSVAEAVTSIEAIVSDPDSRLRSKGYLQADSIQSISSGSVSAGDLELCADGIKRESCPSDDDDEDLTIGLIVLAAIFFVVVALLLRRQKQEEKASDVELDRI